MTQAQARCNLDKGLDKEKETPAIAQGLLKRRQGRDGYGCSNTPACTGMALAYFG